MHYITLTLEEIIAIKNSINFTFDDMDNFNRTIGSFIKQYAHIIKNAESGKDQGPGYSCDEYMREEYMNDIYIRSKLEDIISHLSTEHCAQMRYILAPLDAKLKGLCDKQFDSIEIIQVIGDEGYWWENYLPKKIRF